MKKNILKATLVATFALLAGYNVYNSQKAEGMSELALANVEALADDNEIENYHGFALKSYANGCKICQREDGGICNVHNQVPC